LFDRLEAAEDKVDSTQATLEESDRPDTRQVLREELEREKAEKKLLEQKLTQLKLSPGALKPATFGRLSALQNQPPLLGCCGSRFSTFLWNSGSTYNLLCLAESSLPFFGV
jgi:hypothetical protein